MPEEETAKEEQANNDPRPVVEFQTLYFEFAKTQMLEESSDSFQYNLSELKKSPSVVIKLVGHTDNIGSDNENAILAMERAMKVAILLKQNGISEDRIRLEARGECCPIAPNNNQKKVYLNRRVEFVIINE